MNRRIATTVVGSILVAVLGVTACGSGSSSGSSSTAEDTTLTVYVTPTQNEIYRVPSQQVLLVEPDGSTRPLGGAKGVGDGGIYNSTILSSPSGATVGSATDISTTMNTAGLVHSDSSLTLKKGTLFVVSNFNNGAPTQTFAITGGSGAYDDSRGHVSVAQGSGDESIVKIDID
jgi:hypothetical protein